MVVWPGLYTETRKHGENMQTSKRKEPRRELEKGPFTLMTESVASCQLATARAGYHLKFFKTHTDMIQECQYWLMVNVLHLYSALVILTTQRALHYMPQSPIPTQIHTALFYTYKHSHTNARVQYPAKGHCDMQTSGARDRTTNISFIRRPTLLPEPPLPPCQNLSGCLKNELRISVKSAV